MEVVWIDLEVVFAIVAALVMVITTSMVVAMLKNAVVGGG